MVRSKPVLDYHYQFAPKEKLRAPQQSQPTLFSETEKETGVLEDTK